MDEENKDLPLVVAEILIEMQQMRQEMRQDRQEMIQIFNRSFDLVIEKLGEIKTEVKGLRTTVEQADKRVANIEQSLTGEYERRLRVLEEIVLRKAS